jgi:hypothetical protein
LISGRSEGRDPVEIIIFFVVRTSILSFVATSTDSLLNIFALPSINSILLDFNKASTPFVS